MLHSAWALSVGTGVVLAARERYHLVLWVVLFLALTWTSTLFFGRLPAAERSDVPPGLAQEITSYLTRVMYQETLFFLLPFYAYSTVADSPNVLFLVLLGALALFSCIDLIFDRWLRTRPLFALTYFAIIAFSATNLLLPLLFGLRLHFATPLAALVAIAAAAPLAARTVNGRGWAVTRLVIGAAVFVLVAVGLPVLVPPVPLRLQSATFSSGINPQSLALTDTLRTPATPAAVGRSLVVLVEVFAPSDLPAQVRLEWRRNGSTIRRSRPVDIVANENGFRVWDAWSPPAGDVAPGDYQVVLRTRGARVFGVARIDVRGG
jgi:hypothetical protein